MVLLLVDEELDQLADISELFKFADRLKDVFGGLGRMGFEENSIQHGILLRTPRG